MPASTIKRLDWKGLPLIEVTGYFDQQVGLDLTDLVFKFLKEGHVRWILDLSHCDVVNSNGISQLLEITMRTTEDYRGHLTIVGMAPLMERVFRMAGVLPQAEAAATLQDVAA